MTDIDEDSSGNVIAAGQTESSDFAVLSSVGNPKGFVVFLQSNNLYRWMKYFQDYSSIDALNFNYA